MGEAENGAGWGALLVEMIRIYSKGTKAKPARYVFKCPTCGVEVVLRRRDGEEAKQCKACYCKTLKGHTSPSYKHGGKVGSKRLYVIWQNMRRRCQEKTNHKYHRYGGRGISVCPEWEDFTVFRLWAESAGYEDGLTIDRIDIDGNYCPGNCRYITLAENSKYKSTTKVSDEKAEIVRRVCCSGASRKDIAALLDVSCGTIAAIMTGKTHNPINPA